MRCHWDGQGQGHSKPAANPGAPSPATVSRAGAHPHVGIGRHPMAPLELGALEPELVWLMAPLLALLLSGWLGECGSTGIVVWSSRRAQINKPALLNSSKHQ